MQTPDFKVLFVCTGNICRSPTAQGIFEHLLASQKLNKIISCDSAGLSKYHLGEPPDERSQYFAMKRGYDLSKQKSRFFTVLDFENFDLILAMDHGHLQQLQVMANADNQQKVQLMLDYSNKWKGISVPDPYSSGDAGFELVLDQLEEACFLLLEKIKVQTSSTF